MKEKEQYIDFDAYERAKEPHKREKAYYWATAIGLQKVDGRFFRNLLLGEHNELKNRYMLINPPEEWKQTDPTSNPSSKKNENFLTDNEYILKLVSSIKEEFLSLHQIMTALGLKDRVSFRKVYLVPALEEGFIKMLHPENPKHPRQKYRLTVKGLALYNNIKGKIKDNAI